jgi:DNA replication and repair protein RecF
MQITRIILENFRNYVQQDLTVYPDINVFFGANAQGKTNILEAVYLCACARSHRTSRDQDLINQQADQYRIVIQFKAGNGAEEEIEIRYLEAVSGDPQRTRAIRIINHNGIRLEKVSELMGLFHAVIFAPEDLMLVKEGPSSRRRYMDLLISQVRPTYFQDLQRYARYLQQRNKLLKDLRDQHAEPSMQLDIWDQSLATYAAHIIHQRLLFTQRISEKAAAAQLNISSGQEQLSLRYRTVSGITPVMGVDEINELLYKKLKNIVHDDIARGTTSIGPHRDDIDLILNGEPLKPYASQGQQRSVVLALKLAELTIIQQDIGEQPVLLLDDVMSELDANRRRCLLESIDMAQVFVTCTDADHVVSDIRDAGDRQFTFYAVDQGHVSFVQPGPDIQGQI